MIRNRLAMAALICGPLGGMGAPPARASCSTCTCSMTVTNLSFGTYDASAAAPRDSTGSVTVQCSSPFTINSNFDIMLSTGGSGSYATRQMAKGTDRLNYNVYADAARTQLWGNGSNGTYLLRATVSGTTFFTANATGYGRIAAGQWNPAGTYTDTLVVTVTY